VYLHEWTRHDHKAASPSIRTPQVTDGGPYGVDRVDFFRRAATYVDRVLRGEKPGDLPVQFPTKFEMVVNRKTATALGLTVPPSIMLRADEVIEQWSGATSGHPAGYQTLRSRPSSSGSTRLPVRSMP
jgi:hypothetical protein